MVDFDALQACGLHNPRGRADLIKYLDSLGFTAEDMVAADSRGRLFGLAGDVLQWSGRPVYSVRSAADTLGVPAGDVAHAWRLLGLDAADPDEIILSATDVEGLATWLDLKRELGADSAFGFLRVLGATMARLAEAESALIRTGVPEIQVGHTRDELATAQAYRATAEFVPRIAVLVDAVHRHHLASARTHFERVIRDSSAAVVCGVGFADLTGFTALTHMLTTTELSTVLNEFSAAAGDVMHANGARVVKFIGDEVMWVSATPESLAAAAVDLVNHPEAREAGLLVRAGIGYGEVLAINGDYFGTTVNLAARLVAAAQPGQILASQALRDELPHWPVTASDPLTLKGFEEPVVAYELHPRR